MFMYFCVWFLLAVMMVAYTVIKTMLRFLPNMSSQDEKYHATKKSLVRLTGSFLDVQSHNDSQFNQTFWENICKFIGVGGQMNSQLNIGS